MLRSVVLVLLAQVNSCLAYGFGARAPTPKPPPTPKPTPKLYAIELQEVDSDSEFAESLSRRLQTIKERADAEEASTVEASPESHSPVSSSRTTPPRGRDDDESDEDQSSPDTKTDHDGAVPKISDSTLLSLAAESASFPPTVLAPSAARILRLMGLPSLLDLGHVGALQRFQQASERARPVAWFYFFQTHKIRRSLEEAIAENFEHPSSAAAYFGTRAPFPPSSLGPQLVMLADIQHRWEPRLVTAHKKQLARDLHNALAVNVEETFQGVGDLRFLQEYLLLVTPPEICDDLLPLLYPGQNRPLCGEKRAKELHKLAGTNAAAEKKEEKKTPPASAETPAALVKHISRQKALLFYYMTRADDAKRILDTEKDPSQKASWQFGAELVVGVNGGTTSDERFLSGQAMMDVDKDGLSFDKLYHNEMVASWALLFG